MASEKYYFLPNLPPWQAKIKWAPRQNATLRQAKLYSSDRNCHLGNPLESLKITLVLMATIGPEINIEFPKQSIFWGHMR